MEREDRCSCSLSDRFGFCELIGAHEYAWIRYIVRAPTFEIAGFHLTLV